MALIFPERRELSFRQSAVVGAERPLDLRAVGFEPRIVGTKRLAVDRESV